ncbi:BMP-binding endothelial regulator protein-like [Saccoglossus kowalevskii]|uniref:BMP-binding endothelial regulator protein-like n=1 Tax=Saccoglossus kowalevskii TaxID=10224 RepID=A0ABM0MY59_SACKO|nr:PREDICTED: BMP-binding endothelial regulator protein-like [Saccoglossus kowalevskii]
MLVSQIMEGGSEHCTELWKAEGLWNDVPCSLSLGHAICQFANLNPGVRGDPHMTTFDGRAYAFQGTCWYTLFKDCSSNSGFEVTTKFESRKDNISAEIRTRVVSFSVTVGKQYAVVDGLEILTGPTDEQLNETQAIHVHREDKQILLHFTLQDTTFTLQWTLRNHGLSVSYYGSAYNGKLCGLMGNADGNPLNDFKNPDGSVVRDVDEFGKSWKLEGKNCD